MDQFPFSDDEWSRVRAAALEVLNATLADDLTLRSSYFEELRARLGELQAKHGEHPLLLETEADFCDDSEERLGLYLCALSLAESAGQTTHTIRIALARVLLADFGEITHALTDGVCGGGRFSRRCHREARVE